MIRYAKRVLYVPIAFLGGTIIWCFCKPFDRFGHMPGLWDAVSRTTAIVWNDLDKE